MKTIHLTTELPDSEVAKLAGHTLDDSYYDILIGDEDADVFKPNGDPLIKYRRGVLLSEQCSVAYANLHEAAKPSKNRGLAAGIPSVEDIAALNAKTKTMTFIPIRQDERVNMRAIKADGTLSKTLYAKIVDSGLVGFFDRDPRFPYCRLTAFTLNEPNKFNAALPLIRTIDAVFKECLPDRYAAQMEQVLKTDPNFFISGTVFTTITVNMNFRTAVHKDVGDLKAGFGVMCAIRLGKYTGGYLVFPKYRVAVNMQTRDVCLADVHEWHGNTQIVGKRYKRMSLVLYYREGMTECQTPQGELDRAKRLPRRGVSK